MYFKNMTAQLLKLYLVSLLAFQTVRAQDDDGLEVDQPPEEAVGEVVEEVVEDVVEETEDVPVADLLDMPLNQVFTDLAALPADFT